jgi:hypothetical protein
VAAVAWMLVAWGAAIVFAVVLLGFCAYELRWKQARLMRDLAVLQADLARLTDLQGRLVLAPQWRRVKPGGLS